LFDGRLRIERGKMVLATWPLTSSNWEMPPWPHTLFRLQRFGVRAPRLRAVGASSAQVSCSRNRWRRFLSIKRSPRRPQPAPATAGASGAAHPAGSRGRLRPPRWRRVGTPARRRHADGAVVLAQVEPLCRGNASWQQLAPTEFNRQRFFSYRAPNNCVSCGYVGRCRARSAISRATLGKDRPSRKGSPRHEFGAWNNGVLSPGCPAARGRLCRRRLVATLAARRPPAVRPRRLERLPRDDLAANASMAADVTDDFHEKQGRSTGRVVLEAGGKQLVVYLKRHFHCRAGWAGWRRFGQQATVPGHAGTPQSGMGKGAKACRFRKSWAAGEFLGPGENCKASSPSRN